MLLYTDKNYLQSNWSTNRNFLLVPSKRPHVNLPAKVHNSLHILRSSNSTGLLQQGWKDVLDDTCGPWRRLPLKWIKVSQNWCGRHFAFFHLTITNRDRDRDDQEWWLWWKCRSQCKLKGEQCTKRIRANVLVPILVRKSISNFTRPMED